MFHKSLIERSLALASSLALSTEKLKFGPIKLTVYQMLIDRTSTTQGGGDSLMYLTKKFHVEMILFHTFDPLDVENLWIL